MRMGVSSGSDPKHGAGESPPSRPLRSTVAVAVFCLLHGNWHDSSCWNLLGPLLSARGHDVVTPDLPFDRPQLSYTERALPAMLALEGAHDGIVVVGHSVASAEAGLVAAGCDARLLVYLCPRLAEFPPPPDPPPVFRAGVPFPPRRQDGTLVWEPGAATAAMYPRLDSDIAAELAGRLRPGAPPSGSYPLAVPPQLPSALIYTSEDEFFTPEWERFCARELLHVEPIEMAGGHFPMIEQPDELAGLLDQLAENVVAAT
jgi:pimeloyl-ACP methyl ester carboxylesterase